MGLLTGFLAGAGQGLTALGGAMQQDVQKQRDEEIYARRARVLADIERTSSMGRLKDAEAFNTDPNVVGKRREIRAADADAEDARRLAYEQKSGDQRLDQLIKGKVAEGTNPDLVQAEADRADRELDRDIKRINATAGPEAEKAERIAVARAKAEAMYRPKTDTGALKMREVDKVQLDAMGDQIRDLNKAIANGLTDQTLSTENDPKNQGAYKSYQAVLVQRRQLEMKRDAILSQYNDSGASRPDPLGLLGKGGGSGASSGSGSAAPSGPVGDTKVSAAEQGRRDKDRVPILVREYQNARSQEDRAALLDEIKRLPVSLKAEAMARIGEQAAPTGQPAAPAPAAAAAPAAKAAQAAQASPGMLDGLFQSLKAFQAGNAAEGMAMEALRRKVRAGETMTAEEQQQARRFGLI